MPSAVDPSLINRARRLRRNMTDGERRLWSELREFRRWYGIHVRRQAPIGRFVVDFAIHERKLVIEVDGEHHFHPERIRHDKERDGWLAGEGYRVLRFDTGDLSDAFDGCVEEIMDALGLMKDGTTPESPPEGREEAAGMRA